MTQHRAHQREFPQLCQELDTALAAGLVFQQRADSRELYCYTREAVYNRAWSDAAIISRGLIIDRTMQEIVATPFEKFFNFGEHQGPIPETDFEVHEKLDGSLIIIYYWQGNWHTATKGSFNSAQARWAHEFLQKLSYSFLNPGYTYLCEAVGAWNRIVVPYQEDRLVLLAAYDEDGYELSFYELKLIADAVGFHLPIRHIFNSIAALIEHAKQLPANDEGFVIKYPGLRLKLKSDAYCRVHRLISNCTPLALWEAMSKGDNLTLIRRELPEEFYTDFDAIVCIIADMALDLHEKVAKTVRTLEGLSDKEVGIRLAEFDPDIRGFIFPMRKNGGSLLLNPRSKAALFKAIRPTGNNLRGYTPSYAMNRVMEEAA